MVNPDVIRGSRGEELRWMIAPCLPAYLVLPCPLCRSHLVSDWLARDRMPREAKRGDEVLELHRTARRVSAVRRSRGKRSGVQPPRGCAWRAIRSAFRRRLRIRGIARRLTVSASIPISVLSISILRAFGRSTILENNIVQTTGSAGESAAAGVIFTMPALIFLGFSLNTEYWRIFFLALLGGWLGVLFMIPLRRQLIVKEHGNLTFPEGTACADVLVAGSAAGRSLDAFSGGWVWAASIRLL